MAYLLASRPCGGDAGWSDSRDRAVSRDGALLGGREGAWGPRYISIALPFAVLPLAGYHTRVDAMARGRTARLARDAVVWGLVAVGLFVNLYGAAVNFNTWVVTADENKRNFEPYYSALAAHPRILAERIGEWWPGLNPPQGVLLRDGFSYSEGKDGAPLPRWTLADARFTVNAGAPIPLTIRYADHRPPPLPRAAVSLWVDGKRVDAAAKPLGGVESQFTVTAPAGAPLELRSDTWNPSAVGQSDRDENLGVQVVSISRADDAPLAVTALPQIPGMPNSGFGRWAWFYRPDYHHAIDLWAWYLAVSGAPPGIAARIALIVLIPSVLLLGLAGWLAYAMRPARHTISVTRSEANVAGRA